MMSITCRKKIFVKICRKDIEAGKIDVLIVDEKIVGTGSRTDNHITRVYVLPEYEGKGYGTEIMNHLENEIFSAYDYCDLEHRGYKTVEHKKHNIGDGEEMIYEIMRKEK